MDVTTKAVLTGTAIMIVCFIPNYIYLDSNTRWSMVIYLAIWKQGTESSLLELSFTRTTNFSTRAIGEAVITAMDIIITTGGSDRICRSELRDLTPFFL